MTRIPPDVMAKLLVAEERVSMAKRGLWALYDEVTTKEYPQAVKDRVAAVYEAAWRLLRETKALRSGVDTW